MPKTTKEILKEQFKKADRTRRMMAKSRMISPEKMDLRIGPPSGYTWQEWIKVKGKK